MPNSERLGRGRSAQKKKATLDGDLTVLAVLPPLLDGAVDGEDNQFVHQLAEQLESNHTHRTNDDPTDFLRDSTQHF
jgi:hypothetical protein